MNDELLNLNQSSEELSSIHGERDYYHYLRSPEFIEAFFKPMAHLIDSFGDPVLDAGCGEGVLAELVHVPYHGFDGSMTAVGKAAAKLKKVGDSVYHARIEDLPYPGGRFPTVVFSGIMEVIVKADKRVELLEMYAARFNVKRFVICDLERLDTSMIDARYGPPFFECYRVAAGVETEEVKRRRKILAWEVRS